MQQRLTQQRSDRLLAMLSVKLFDGLGELPVYLEEREPAGLTVPVPRFGLWGELMSAHRDALVHPRDLLPLILLVRGPSDLGDFTRLRVGRVVVRHRPNTLHVTDVRVVLLLGFSRFLLGVGGLFVLWFDHREVCFIFHRGPPLLQ